MDFLLSDEQRALRDMARDVFARVYPPARLRELWDGKPRGTDAWRTLAEQGLVGLTVPEEHGGSGGDAVDLMVVLEEAGRACVPEPLLDTAAAAVAVLAQAGGEVAQRWLPQIASGDAVVAVQLDGQPFVGDADIADLLLLQSGDDLTAVERGAFTATSVPSEDRARRLFTVESEAGERIGPAATAWLHGALGSAAVLNGIAGALLDQTVEYVKVRQQFGVPVGSFQAVKHKLASVYATLESSRAATRYAAYAAANALPDAATAAAIAKIHAVDAESLANDEALQCHAGIGFTWEHDLHFWLKRGRAFEHLYGSARDHRRVVAAALLDGAKEEPDGIA